MFEELNVQWGLLNRTVLWNGIEEARLLHIVQEVEKGKEWSRQMEEGQLVMMVERIQKLEDQMAEKDEEIAVLQGKVWLVWALL